jgi:CubicO group peptidase (beta-lactamase class C family)
VPEEQEPNVATVHQANSPTIEEMTAGMIETTGLDPDTVTAWMSAVWGEDSVQARAGTLGGAFDYSFDHFSTREWRAAESPGANMFASARSVARMYAATVSDVDGVRLLNPDTVKRASEVQTDKTRMHSLPPELDIPANRSFNMSLGFWRACPPMPLTGPAAFGHPGSGGSIGFADPDNEVGFGYVTNLWSFRIGEPRAQNLADAV